MAMVYYSMIPITLMCLFFAITFLQSGIDKVMNLESNLGWFKSVFGNTFLGKIITPSFYWITIQEIALGLFAVFAIIKFWVYTDPLPANITFVASFFVLIQLFFGQRIAKDYVGATGIVPYIIMSILGIFLSIISLN